MGEDNDPNYVTAGRLFDNVPNRDYCTPSDKRDSKGAAAAVDAKADSQKLSGMEKIERKYKEIFDDKKQFRSFDVGAIKMTGLNERWRATKMSKSDKDSDDAAD